VERTRYAVIAAAGAALSIFAVFVALAQIQSIFVPYFTPVRLQVDGLMEKYAQGQNGIFNITAAGYGSNCHSLEVQADYGDQRVSYYNKADDCRFMMITHGPYKYTRSFEYGTKIMGKEGTYTVNIIFKDLIDNKQVQTTRKFEVRG
jgi:hypothetical protein